MKKLLALLLLCPLASVAADWRYDGEAAAGSSAGQPAMSESTDMRMAGSAGPAPPQAPGNNMTMAQVRRSKGEPENIWEGIGDPPIARWQYPGYVVYFEHDRVITSVAGRW